MKLRWSWTKTGLLTVMAFLGVAAGTARAGNVLEITDGDATPQSAALSPGDSITLLVLLSGPGDSPIDSFLFDVEFSAPGLFYRSYEFEGTAFQAGDPLDDFSMPGLSDLPQPPASPHVITAASFSRAPLSPNLVDIHFEAVSAVDAEDVVLTFETGVLARIHLSVPPDFATGSVLISPKPDEFALRGDVVDTVPGAAFQLSVTGTTAPTETPGSGGGSTGGEGSAPSPTPPPPPDEEPTPVAEIPDTGSVEGEDGGEVVADDVSADDGDSGENGAADDDGGVVTTEPAPPQEVPTDSEEESEGASGGSGRAARPSGVCGALGMFNLAWVLSTLVGLRRPWRGLRRPAPGLP